MATSNFQDKACIVATSVNGTGIAASGSSVGLQATSANGIGMHAQSEHGIALRVEGQLQVFGPSVGQVVTRGGETSLEVVTEAATEHSNILLTPLSNPKAFLWIDSRTAGKFSIAGSNPLPARLTIQYLIIN